MSTNEVEQDSGVDGSDRCFSGPALCLTVIHVNPSLWLAKIAEAQVERPGQINFEGFYENFD